MFYFPIPEDRIHPGKERITTNGEERSMAAETANTLLLSTPRMQGGEEGGRNKEYEGGRKREGRKIASKLDGGDVHHPCLLLRFLQPPIKHH